MTQQTAARLDAGRDEACFHCGLPVLNDGTWTITVHGHAHAVCCPACQAVANAIINGGLDDFYRFRTDRAPVPDLDANATRAFADPGLADLYTRKRDDGLVETDLILSGIHCAACVWLNEHNLQRLPGIREAEVNYATHRAHVVWDPAGLSLGAILRAINAIGYQARPYDAMQREQQTAAERRDYIKRIGVAGVLGAQIMMLAVALYFGEHGGIAPLERALLRWASLLLAVPVVLYAAHPFYTGAWRDLRARRAGMDVPVMLGISIAFAGSLWATWSGSGAVYFESVAMFVFFLLTARFLESRGRARSVRQLEELARALPATAMRRHGGDRYELVMASSLVPGDEVLVRPGDAIPADGIVTDGSSSTDESLLTGESQTIPKAAGATVLGGSVNLDAPLSIRVTRDCGASTLSQIVKLSDRAQRTKPHVAQVADRVAGWFVAAVLVLAAITAAVWWVHDPALWLPVTISVLVVTCPCALSLATPTAMAAAVTHLAQRGMVTLRRDALEALAAVDHVMLDKTGTLTAGALRLTGVRLLGTEDEARSLQVARALERHSNHPVAGAFRTTGDAGMKESALEVKQLQFVAGAGITGEIDGRRYALGRDDWVTTTIGIQMPAVTGGDATLVWLANDHGPVAVFELADRLREDADSALDELRALDLDVSICSGDREQAVRAAALQLHVGDYRSALSPDDKLAYVRDLQNHGARVLAVGDGVNDAPVLSAAHASIAMARGADITHNRADLVLLNDSLKLIPAAVRLARRARRVIRQNLVWAAAYNLLALPAAVMGLVPPWLAAIGMSASSLIVVANALRLAPAATRRRASRVEPG